MNKNVLILLLMVFSVLSLQAQRLSVPSELAGSWQDVNWQPGTWNGPVFASDHIAFYYQIFYVEDIGRRGDGGTTLYLVNNRNEKRTLTIKRQGTDTLAYRFADWDERMAVRVPQQTKMEAVSCSDLPERLFSTRWVPAGNDTAGIRFDKAGRVQFRGDDWAIDGVRRDETSGQFELLLKAPGRYKLMYLRSIHPAFLDLASELHNDPMVAASPYPGIDRIKGVWTDAATNDWVYGFFENFAIYRNECWNYAGVGVKKNKAEIVLEKDGQRVRLQLALEARADSVCRIAAGKEKKRTYIRYTRLPDYTIPDTASFCDSGYRPDSVTITGYFRGVAPGKPIEFSVNNPVNDQQESYYAESDSFGRFRIVVPVMNTCELFIDWRRLNVFSIVEPGEQVMIYADFPLNTVRFMGKNARLHQEMYAYRRSDAYKRMIYYTDSYDLKVPHSEYYDRQQRIYCGHRDLLEAFLSQHPGFSERFKTYQRRSNLSNLGRQLMQRSFALSRSRKERLDPAYMRLPDSLFACLPQPYSLTGLDFVRGYLDYYSRLNSVGTMICIPAVDGVRYLQRAGRLSLTPQQEADLKTYEQAVYASIDLFEQKADSATRTARMAPYSPAMERLKPLLEDSLFTTFYRNEWPALGEELLEGRWLQQELSAVDSLCTDPLLREIITTGKFLGNFDNNRRALYESTLALFLERVKNPVFVEQVMKRQRYYEELSGQEIAYIESLKRTDHLTESKDADHLFAQLIEPYRGKVIYLDIWGTWCGPCKDQMKYAGAIKEKLKDEEVVFMYLADRSPEVSWKNIIREYHLTGPNVVHYNLPDEQQQMLERRLGISSFPTFILIDREGRIVDRNAPRPQEGERLLRAIGQLLGKRP